MAGEGRRRQRIGMLQTLTRIAEKMPEGIAIARDYLIMNNEAKASEQLDAVLAGLREVVKALEEVKGGGDGG